MENTLDNVRSQMRKGLLEYCILSILDKREAYASVIIEELKAVGMIVVEGTLYPLLHALEKAGEVRAYERIASSGRTRRYYALTARGRGRLAEKTEEWRFFSESVNAVLRAAAAPAI